MPNKKQEGKKKTSAKKQQVMSNNNEEFGTESTIDTKNLKKEDLSDKNKPQSKRTAWN